jgi:hypothetical protein
MNKDRLVKLKLYKEYLLEEMPHCFPVRDTGVCEQN